VEVDDEGGKVVGDDGGVEERAGEVVEELRI
jgi:hypothetical protein